MVVGGWEIRLNLRSNLMKTLLVISLLTLLAGCDSGTLETGYAPRKLNDNTTVRQSYYASPFSPEAAEGGSTMTPGLSTPSHY